MRLNEHDPLYPLENEEIKTREKLKKLKKLKKNRRKLKFKKKKSKRKHRRPLHTRIQKRKF
ncbi:hypothetical protein ES703_84223 [subsurface metagenome]